MKFVVFVLLSICHFSLCTASDNSTSNEAPLDIDVVVTEAYAFLAVYYDHLNDRDYSIISVNFSGNVAGTPVTRQQYIDALQKLQSWIPDVYNNPIIDETTYTAEFVNGYTFKINFQNKEVWTIDIVNDNFSLVSLVAQ